MSVSPSPSPSWPTRHSEDTRFSKSATGADAASGEAAAAAPRAAAALQKDAPEADEAAGARAELAGSSG